MSEYDSIYRVITPIGVFEAVFGEEDAPVEYRGDKVAILFFKNWLSINQISGEHGIMLNEHNLTPNELYGFCQPAGSGITVIPPLDDMLAFAEQESMDQDEEQSKTEETNNMQDAMTMDAVSGVEKIKLIKELSGIRSSLQSVKSGIEKLSLVKRIKEIRGLLGINAATSEQEVTNPEPSIVTPEPDANHEQKTEQQIDQNQEQLTPVQKMKNAIASFGGDIVLEMNDTAIAFKLQGDTFNDKEPPYLKYLNGGFKVIYNDGEIKSTDSYINPDDAISEYSSIRKHPGKHWNKDRSEEQGKAAENQEKSDSDNLDSNGLDSNGMWPVTQGEYNKIPKDYRGIGEDGIPRAMKLVNGVTKSVPVRFIDESNSEGIIKSTPITQQELREAAIRGKEGFIAELETLKSETDINIFNAKLDDIATRIEQAGLMEALDTELNAAADVLTRLLAAAEKAQ